LSTAPPYIDRHRIHFLETLLDDDEMFGHAFDRRQNLGSIIAHQIDGLVEKTVGVNIDRLDAFPADFDGQTWRSRLAEPHRAGRNYRS
jgi:hypothetical protein